MKAEEYCERAVLVKPDDGEILSMYGDLIWSNHGDGARAQSYFDRAVQASPDDWYNFFIPFNLPKTTQFSSFSWT